jgi:dipeptidyl aminopeptidase/acylaminoacyl peptidase
MGGLEALVAAGSNPDLFAAVVAFNPIIDLAAWQKALASTDVNELRSFGTAERIVEEVGVHPAESPESYSERSATSYLDGLCRVPTMLFWSAADLVVPQQATEHAYRLYCELKARGISTPVSEYEHSACHGVPATSDLVRWQLHEWCDYELALAWLLRHRRAVGGQESIIPEAEGSEPT